MDPRRLRAGEVVAALAGAALLASLFLPWYGDLSGWRALGVIDVLLALLAGLALALVPVTAAQRVPAVPLALAVMVTIAGALAALLVLFRVIDLPPGAGAREYGLWLALAATLGMIGGGCLAMGDERLSAPGRHTDATGRPAPPPAPPETISAARLNQPSGDA